MGCTSAVHLWYQGEQTAQAGSPPPPPPPTSLCLRRRPADASGFPTPGSPCAPQGQVPSGPDGQQGAHLIRPPRAERRHEAGRSANRLRLGAIVGRPAGRNVPGATAFLSRPKPPSGGAETPRQNDSPVPLELDYISLAPPPGRLPANDSAKLREPSQSLWRWAGSSAAEGKVN